MAGPVLETLENLSISLGPRVSEVLQDVVDHPHVRAASLAVVGREEIKPVELLMTLLVIFLSTLLFVLILPKGRLFLWSSWYFVLSGDKKPEKPRDTIFDWSKAQRKTIVFIRHGESEWNQIFNKGPIPLRPFKALWGLMKEAMLLFGSESLFYDSPLSDEGIQQAWELLTFLASQPQGCQVDRNGHRPSPKHPVTQLDQADLVSIIRGDVGESVIVSSILRRAISTGVLGLSTRLLRDKPNDKIVLMTSLQEISRNVDTLSLTPALGVPQVPPREARMPQTGDLMTHFYRNRLDPRLNKGNKTLKIRAKDRQKEFCQWVFSDRQAKLDCIIVCGHSFWFREMFRSFLPKSSSHEAKTNKIANCGVIAFDFYQNSAKVCQIKPESIKTVYLGFAGKGKKGKSKEA